MEFVFRMWLTAQAKIKPTAKAKAKANPYTTYIISRSIQWKAKSHWSNLSLLNELIRFRGIPFFHLFVAFSALKFMHGYRCRFVIGFLKLHCKFYSANEKRNYSKRNNENDVCNFTFSIFLQIFVQCSNAHIVAPSCEFTTNQWLWSHRQLSIVSPKVLYAGIAYFIDSE